MQKPIESAEITVAYVNPPKEGKKWGNIKGTDGNAYFGPPMLLDRFRVGETCKIEYELGGNGGTLKSIKRKIDVRQALQRPAALPPRARTNPTDSEQIFVMALMKERPITKEPEASSVDLIGEINMLRKVYQNTFGGSERQRDDQMNDSIEF